MYVFTSSLSQGRERHLEDLMEAKTQALSQSDRLLAQFRCRQAQADAEVHAFFYKNQ